MAGKKFVIGNKTKLSFKILDDAFLAAYDPAAPVAPTGLIPLVGGTSANEQINAEETSSVVFGDDLGFSDGLVTSQSWSIEYSFNALGNDPAFSALQTAGLNAIDTLCWIRKESPAPSGFTTGRVIEGIVSVMGFSLNTTAEGIIEGSSTLQGRGAPIVRPPA